MAKTETYKLCMEVPCGSAKKIRQQLEQQDIFDADYCLKRMDKDCVALPVKSDEKTKKSIYHLWPDCQLKLLSVELSKRALAKLEAPAFKLASEIHKLIQEKNLPGELSKEIPRKWERHQDLVILPSSSFVSREWDRIESLWEVVSSCLSCKRLARRAAVANNGVRSSQVTLLLGTDGVVTHKDNNIRYTFDVTKCMFSSGNISEKLRVAGWDCTGQTVVDLYAGIGYFTLPYLVHAGAAYVHACDWNPAAVAALRHNLADNAVEDRCTVHEGDCRQLDIGQIADRVNLGLIPSSEGGWPTAVRVLGNNGGFLHIHSNVEEGWPHPDKHVKATEKTGGERLAASCQRWAAYAVDEISHLLHTTRGPTLWSVEQRHLENVKSYAPHVVHVVLDVECRPITTS